MVNDSIENSEIDMSMLKNKLFCTFTTLENLDDTIADINLKYSIVFKKIFILSSPDTPELMCTYNIEQVEPIVQIIKNTILVHRKKDSNTLYTINSLNALIKNLNNGVLDNSFIINWQDYKNCILLYQDQKFKKLPTQIHKIINLN